MNPAAPEEKETSSELEQPQKVDDAPGEILLSKEVCVRFLYRHNS